MFMPKKGGKNSTQEMKDSKLYKILYLLPIPMFGSSFLLNIMCFRRETMGFYIHKKDKENSIRAIRQIYLGESIEEYNERYEEMCADDDLNYKDPGDYLAAAKASTTKMTKIINKLEKAENEVSGEISEISKELSEASAAIDNASKDVSDAESDIQNAPDELMAAAAGAAESEASKLQKQVQDGDVMGLYKEAKGLKDEVKSDISKLDGLGSAIAKEKK